MVNEAAPAKLNPENDHSLTSRRIAYLLIAAFSAGLVIVLLGAIVFESGSGGDPGPWLEIFKSGFLILGGSLSSIVGYYFGSRGTQIAEQSVRAAQAELEERKKALEEKEALTELLRQQLAAGEFTSIDDEGIVEGIESSDIQAFKAGAGEQGNETQ